MRQTLQLRSIQNVVIIGMVIDLAYLFRSQLEELSAYLIQHPTEIRPSGIVALLISSALLIGVLMTVLPIVQQFRHSSSWAYTRRNVNWWLIAVSVIALAVVFIAAGNQPTRGPFAGLTPMGVLPLIIPLMAGLQAATVISLEDERTLELPLTYQRPFAWLVAESALLALAMQLLLGLVGTFITLQMATARADLAALLLAWLPPTILFWGIGLRISIGTRQIPFSALVVISLWYTLSYFGQALLGQYPYLWLVNPFLPRQHMLFVLPNMLTAGDYLLNRALITVLGLLLFASALYELRNEEWVLTGRYPILLRRKTNVNA